MALVKAKETLFWGGHRRRPGDVFEWNGKIDETKVEVLEESEVDRSEIKVPVDPRTNADLAKLLDGYGVKYPKGANKTTLLALLAECEAQKVNTGDPAGADQKGVDEGVGGDASPQVEG